jgi:hypothetical protein
MPEAAIRTALTRMATDSRANLIRGSTCRVGSKDEQTRIDGATRYHGDIVRRN